MSTIHHTEPDLRVRHVASPPPAAVATGRRESRAGHLALGVLRLSLGWTFLWAFLDKLFALGFSTGRNPDTGVVDRFGPAAWINGGSPTTGFLKFGTKGPLADFYQGMAGSAWADWLFMIGLLGIGLALLLGIGVRVAAVTGSLLMVLMWTAEMLPDTNPFMDYHLINAIAMIAIALLGAGRYLGLGGQWEQLPVVRRHGWLK